MDLLNRVLFPVGEWIFLFVSISRLALGAATSYSVVTRAHFPLVKWPDLNLVLPSSADIKNA
jgi:hypothetical protein